MYIAEIDNNGKEYLVVIENIIVLQNITHRYLAHMALLGYIWVFNIQYPKSEKTFFEFLQKILLKIDRDAISQKLAVAMKRTKHLF